MSIKTDEENKALEPSSDQVAVIEQHKQPDKMENQEKPIPEPVKTVHIRSKRHGLYDWFEMDEQEVLDSFASLKNATKVGSGDEQFVFVEGERDNRVLLVAHADTVLSGKPEVGYSKGTFFSKKKGLGIGADDRAGIAMLWQLRKMGHSLLIPNGEESHGVGSRFLMNQEDWAKKINAHQFAIEMDRCNAKDMAFYDVGSLKFKDWCEKQFKGYKRVGGSYTDICELCKPMCGMNISVGYYDQHREEERLVELEWQTSLNLLRKLLDKKDLPRFEQDPPTPYVPQISNRFERPMDRKEYDSSDQYWSRQNSHTSLPVSRVSYNGKCDDIIVCTNCEGVMDVSEYRKNGSLCIFCKGTI